MEKGNVVQGIPFAISWVREVCVAASSSENEFKFISFHTFACFLYLIHVTVHFCVSLYTCGHKMLRRERRWETQDVHFQILLSLLSVEFYRQILQIQRNRYSCTWKPVQLVVENTTQCFRSSSHRNPWCSSGHLDESGYRSNRLPGIWLNNERQQLYEVVFQLENLFARQMRIERLIIYSLVTHKRTICAAFACKCIESLATVVSVILWYILGCCESAVGPWLTSRC